jgi:hypothetical protein
MGAEMATPATGRGLVPHIDHIGARLARFARGRTGATARAVRARLVRLRRNAELHQQDLKQSTSARSVQLPPLIPTFSLGDTRTAGEGAAPTRPLISSQLAHTGARPTPDPAPALGAGRQRGSLRSAPARKRRLARGAIALGAAAALVCAVVAYAVSRGDYTKPSPLPAAEGLTPAESSTTTTSPVGSAIVDGPPQPPDNGSTGSAAALSPSRDTRTAGTARVPSTSAGRSTGGTAAPVAATPSNPPPASSPPPSTPPPSSSPPNPLCQLVLVLCR